ncbi:hypothetical protein [Promicromonospora sp. NPDC059942]|uniref:hypothetical protein n=1 Tax=Promicromonospora sp. NPDC059942 TaxID=3347009 RepID=UPI003658F812
MPPSRLRRHLTLWLIVGPACVLGLALAFALVAAGASITIDSWRATHGGIRGEFTTSGPECFRRCSWNDGEFRSYDGTYEVADASLWSLGGSGDPPRATGVTVYPVVVAPGGDTVYYPDDKTWMFSWLMAAAGPVVCWQVVAKARGLRERVLERGTSSLAP